MPNLNKLTVIGHVGREPELRYTAQGQGILSFSVAVNHSSQKGGEWVKETEWFKVTAFGKQAESVNGRLAKGDAAYIEGRLRSRSYDAKDGTKRFEMEIVADRVIPLSAQPTATGPVPLPDDLPF